MNRRLGLITTLWLSASMAAAESQTPDEIAHLLAGPEAPAGVVFEVLEDDEDALVWAIARIRHHVERLRARFPDLEIAVVTHGREQFALQSRYREDFPTVHSGVEALIAETAVPVHVCETHAGWFGVAADDFPDYVNVAPAAPAQINSYLELGYERVRVEGPAD